MIGSLLALVATAHLARSLGVEVFGAFNLGRTIVEYALIPISFGFSEIASRAIASSGSAAEQRMIAGRAVVLRAGAGMLGAAVLAVTIAMLSDGPIRTVTLVVALSVPFQLTSVDWVFTAYENQRWPSFVRTLGRCLYALLIIVLVRNRQHVVLAAGALALEVAVVNVLLWFRARSLVSLTGQSVWDFRRLQQHLLAAIPVGIGGLAGRFKTSVDLLMLGVLATSLAVGYYAAAYRVVLFVNALANLYAAVLLPRISRSQARGDDFAEALRSNLRMTTALTAALAVGGLAVAKTAVLTLFGRAYLPATAVLALLLVASGLIVTSAALGNVGIALGRTRRYARIMSAGALINIVGNLIAIPLAGMYGAAVVTLVTEAIICGSLLLLLRDTGITAAYRRGWVLRLAVVLAGMYLAMLPVAGLNASLWVMVSVGGGSFLGLSLALRVLPLTQLRRVLGAA
ncbi:MAG: flippase [Coriobacteriia bacterium]|nr:flippase [Coriobacteriia bacterium]